MRILYGLLLCAALCFAQATVSPDDILKVTQAAFLCGRIDGVRSTLASVGGYYDKIQQLDKMWDEAGCPDVKKLMDFK